MSSTSSASTASTASTAATASAASTASTAWQRPGAPGEPTAGPALWPLALVVATVLLQFAPVLRGRVYRFEDIASYFEPLWAAAARAMRAGRLPVWDGGAWSGQPIAGDPQLGAFYPLNWLWCLLPVLRAYAVCAALHALLAGLGMYALARVRGASRPAAGLAGVALGAGGYVVLQTRHIMFVEATAWMPWLVAAGWRLIDSGRPRYLAATAACAGLLLLTGGVSMIYYGAWFAAAVLLARALSLSTPSGLRLRRLGLLGLAGGLGVLLAAPSLWPAAAHGALSPRALGADEAFAASVAWPGLWFLPSLFVPNLLGQQVRGNYLGGGTQWEIAGYYSGVLTFALGLLALWRGRPARDTRRGERVALALLMTACVLLAPGAGSPLHHLACRVLPLYSTMRCPPRALYVVALAMPLLAADGLDALLARLAVRPRLACALRVALPLLVAVDLLLTHRAENPSLTLAEAERAAAPEALAFLRTHLGPGERYLNDVHLDHALHNSGLLWGLPSAGGYSSLPLWRYLHLLWMSNHGRVYPYPRLHDDLSAQGLWKFDSPVVDLLAIRFVLTPRAWSAHATGFTRRFAGADGVDVWENTEALPHAFWVDGAQAATAPAASPAAAEREGAAFVAAAAAAPRPFARHHVVPGAGVLEFAEAKADRPTAPLVAASYRSLSPTEIELEVEAPARGELVIAEPAHPGWRATLDGAEVALDTVDYALVGVQLPPGHHRVGLRMTALPVERGLGLGGLALLALLATAAGDLLRSRRSRPASL